jgi:hypothetical protein
MADIYRLSWEMVDVHRIYQYYNADPALYSGVQQMVPNSRIPDRDWHAISKETDNPWDQYNTLREWEAADKEFVRNVKLEQQVASPVWVEIRPEGKRKDKTGGKDKNETRATDEG